MAELETTAAATPKDLILTADCEPDLAADGTGCEPIEVRSLSCSQMAAVILHLLLNAVM
jgi:hypothetical protein